LPANPVRIARLESWRVMLERKVSLRHLKLAMADAHPDRGGTSEQFIAARKRYLDARQKQERRKGRQRDPMGDIFGKYWAKVEAEGRAFVEKALRHRDCLTRSQVLEMESCAYALPVMAKYVVIWGRLKTKANVQPETDYERKLDKQWQWRVKRQEAKAAYKEAYG
jgi:hypothetical protein